MNFVVQKLLQEKLHALYSSIPPMHHVAANTVFVGSNVTLQEGREEPADNTVLDTGMENDINDQESSKNDVKNASNNCKILKTSPKTNIAS